MNNVTVNVGGPDGVMLCVVHGRPDDLNAWAGAVHHLNAKWWHDPATGEPIVRRKRQMLQLMLSEVSEAMEGERKNLMDDKLTTRRMAEVELADVVIRALDWAGGFSIQLIDYVSREGYRLEFARHRAYTFNANNDAGDELFLISRCVHAISHTVDNDNDFVDMGHIHGEPTIEQVLMVATSRLILACECYCHARGYDLWGAAVEKLQYNFTRKDHQAEARLAATGKKW